MIRMLKENHTFNPTLATKVGVENAIFLQDVAHWVDVNQDKSHNQQEGRTWTYSSISDICKRHPYWTKKQVERIVSNCKKNGWILTGCYNEDKRDRTTWYTLSDEMMDFFFEKESNCISPNRENTFLQTGSALPYSKQDSEDNIPPLSPKGEKNQKKELIIPSQEETGFSDKMQAIFEDWLKYKKESHRFIYKETGLKNLIAEIKANIQRYNETIVEQVMRRSISNSWSGIIWDQCKKIQQEIREQKNHEQKYPF